MRDAVHFGQKSKTTLKERSERKRRYFKSK